MNSRHQSGRPLRVLSVDFSYFVEATPQQQSVLFPNAHIDLCGYLNRMNWALAYVDPYNIIFGDLTTATILEEQLTRLSKLISWQHPNECVIANSHRHAYDFIKKHAKFGAEVFHIDLYDDTRPKEREPDDIVDCDNWLRHLIDEGVVEKGYWVKRDSSETEDSPLEVIPFTSLPTGYDLIYVCRSDWWTPPHLDDAFYDYLVAPIQGAEFPCVVEPEMAINRYTKDFRMFVKEIREQLFGE